MIHKTLSILSLLLMILFSGCDEINSDQNMIQNTEPQEERVYTAQTGGTLHISMRNPQTLNPILNEDATVDTMLRLVFEHLFIPDENLKAIPNLAESVEFSEDGTYAVLTLRDDVVWSDGTPMRANDVIFTLDKIRDNPQSIYAQVTQTIESYSIINQSTIRVNFNTSSRGQGDMFLFPIIPQHYYSGQTDPASERNMRPLGNGPFMFESHTLVREVVLTSNPMSFRPPYIETVHVLIISDIETEFHALGNGIIAVLGANILDFGRYGGTRELNITSVPKYHFDFIGFNFENSIFDDKRVRQAVAYTLPKDEFVDAVYLGQAVRATSPINPMSWIYEENTRRHNIDLESARNLMAESYYIEISSNGSLENITTEESTPLVFRVLVNEENTERVQIATTLKQNLEAIGVTVEFMVYDFEQYMEHIKSRNFDLALAGLNLGLMSDLRFLLHSSQIEYSNFMSYSSRIVDMLLTQAINALDEETYKEIMSNLQKYIGEELPIISIAFRTGVLLTDPSIRGELAPGLNNIYQNIDQWFIVQER